MKADASICRCCSSRTISASSPKPPTASRSCTPDESSSTGPVRAILRDPQHPYTRGLLASMPGSVRGRAPAAPSKAAVPDARRVPVGLRVSSALSRPLRALRRRRRRRTTASATITPRAVTCIDRPGSRRVPARSHARTRTSHRTRTPDHALRTLAMALLEVSRPRQAVRARRRVCSARGTLVKAVDDVSFSDRRRARRSGWSASPAAARRRPAAACCG